MHAGQVLQSFEAFNGVATDVERARILFCLALVMAKLSSSSYFGTEDNSPTALRVYAAGLLKKARQLDPSLCSKAVYEGYMNKLLGLNEAFTCTAMLAGSMIEQARTQPEFNSILMNIKPIAWA